MAAVEPPLSRGLTQMARTRLGLTAASALLRRRNGKGRMLAETPATSENHSGGVRRYPRTAKARCRWGPLVDLQSASRKRSATIRSAARPAVLPFYLRSERAAVALYCVGSACTPPRQFGIKETRSLTQLQSHSSPSAAIIQDEARSG